MERAKSTDKHIVIIGAGPSGLTAAETLKRKGYTNVTVLERADHVGGKCSSFEYESRFYELGAGVLSAANRTVLTLAKKFSVPVVRAEFGQNILFDVENGQPLKEKSLRVKLDILRKIIFTYRRELHRHARLAVPGLAQLDSELCQPFSVWAKKYRLEIVAEELEPFFTGFGYGYFDQIPAAYVLKYYSWDILKAFVRRRMYTFPGGIQQLWTTVAAQQNIQYNTTIKKIVRRNEGITITTTTQTLECDALIVTSPLDEFAQYADASATETHLFSKIQYNDYRTYALFLNNFPQKSGYLPGNFTAARAGEPVFWYQRYADSNLYTFYVLGDWQLADEAVLANIGRVVVQLGGTVERVHTVARWKYFPHITTADMQSGYFDAVEKLQGTQGTYFAGELPNFSTVGLSAEYAEELVERFF